MRACSSKVPARFPTSQPGTLSKTRNNVRIRKRHPHWFLAKCSSQRFKQQGSSEVPRRSQQGSTSKTSAILQQGSSKVPAKFHQFPGSSYDFPARSRRGSVFQFSGPCILLAPLPASEIETRRNRCWEVPTRFRKGSNKVPAHFQQGPGRAFSSHHSLAPEIETQQINRFAVGNNSRGEFEIPDLFSVLRHIGSVWWALRQS